MSKQTEITAIAKCLNARGYAQVDAVYRIAEYVNSHGMLNSKGKIPRGSEERKFLVDGLVAQAEWYTDRTVENYISKAVKVLADPRFKPGAKDDAVIKRNTDVCWEVTRDQKAKPARKPKPRVFHLTTNEQKVVDVIEKAWEDGARIQALFDYIRNNYDVK